MQFEIGPRLSMIVIAILIVIVLVILALQQD
jgi:hypothetical protein